jgi:hypothetical protein
MTLGAAETVLLSHVSWEHGQSQREGRVVLPQEVRDRLGMRIEDQKYIVHRSEDGDQGSSSS